MGSWAAPASGLEPIFAANGALFLGACLPARLLASPWLVRRGEVVGTRVSHQLLAQVMRARPGEGTVSRSPWFGAWRWRKEPSAASTGNAGTAGVAEGAPVQAVRGF